MRTFTSALLILFCSVCLCAQTDSLEYSEEYVELDSVDYVSPIEYAFMMHEDTRWMFKLGFPIPNSYNGVYQSSSSAFNSGKLIGIGYERKMGTEWSLDMSFDFVGTSLNYNNGGITTSEAYFDLKISPRYYFGMKKRMRENNAGNNLSGNYLSAGVLYQRSSSDFQSIVYFAEVGFQRRYLKRGLIDFGFRVGLSDPINGAQSNSFIVGSNLNIGLAFAKDNERFDDNRLCDIFKCFEKQNRLVKFNVISLVNATFVSTVQAFGTRIDVTFEEKFGQSPFSFVTNVSPFYSRLKNANFFTSRAAGFELGAGVRYYYNMRRQIAKGRSGNGLSGNYFSLVYGTNYVYSKVRSGDDENKQNLNASNYALLMGFQRTIADHLYYDISFGFGVREDFFGFPDPAWYLPIHLGIGFRL